MATSGFQVMKEKTPQGGGGIPWGAIGQGVTAALPLIGTILSLREANKNRQFQEYMSSTAHQREAEDLKKAGLNPMLSIPSGASTPSGAMADIPDLGAGVPRLLQVQQFKAQTELLQAQAQREYNSAAVLATDNEEKRGMLGLAAQESRLRAELAQLNLAERRNLFAPAIAGAWASIGQMQSAARAAAARAALDEFATKGAANAADVEDLVKEFPEWARLFYGLFRDNVKVTR